MGRHNPRQGLHEDIKPLLEGQPTGRAHELGLERQLEPAAGVFPTIG